MLAEKRRQYTEEFKRAALRLVTAQGYGVSETARHLGINAQMVGRWTRDFDTNGSAACSGHGRMASDQEELQRLRDDNQRWRLERDMLNKALGFFASGSNCGRPVLAEHHHTWPVAVLCEVREVRRRGF